jgi:hypothetical protein
MTGATMRANKILKVLGLLGVLTVTGGYRGGLVSIPNFEGDTWREALEKAPCDIISQVGDDLQIKNAVIVVKKKSFRDPLITEEDRIKPVDKRCFPKP